jgi:alkylated DNA nucleotide flippase Atl1
VTEHQSVRLFSLGSSVEGEPSFIDPATFKALGAEELRDIERWIKCEPEILGEDICILASQFSNWNKTSDRPDVLGLDRRGKLVVVEIKRDGSGKDQDLQAVRYASYASTFSSDDVIELYRAYRQKEHGENLTLGESKERLDDFIEAEDIGILDDDDTPRIVLVSSGFRPGVTSTVLWLRSFALDISCVQIQPYELRGEIVLTSTTLIPLPEAADFEVKMQSKRQKSASKNVSPVNKDDGEAFIASIPEGHWTSYGDVAAAAGSPKAAQAIGSWLRSEETDLPLVYRVLHRTGEVSKHWTASDPALPPTVADVRQKLFEEGVFFEGEKASQADRWRPEDWLAENEDDAGAA